MIIGNGMLAKAFQICDSCNILIFASGISDSKQVNPVQCIREENLLRSMIQNHEDKLLIYFSSCSIENSNLSCDPYHIHKLNMEKLISSESKEYLIFRLPNIIGPVSNNSKTLLSFLVRNINAGCQIDIWSGSVRNLIDISDIVLISNYIIEHKLYINEIVNIANPTNISILNLIDIINIYFDKTLKYDFIETDSEYLNIKYGKIEKIINILNIKFDNSYIQNAMKKYYVKGSK